MANLFAHTNTASHNSKVKCTCIEYMNFIDNFYNAWIIIVHLSVTYRYISYNRAETVFFEHLQFLVMTNR